MRCGLEVEEGAVGEKRAWYVRRGSVILCPACPSPQDCMGRLPAVSEASCRPHG